MVLVSICEVLTVLFLPFGAINTSSDMGYYSVRIAYKGIQASKDNWCTFPMKGRAGGPGGYLSLMKRRELNRRDLKSSSPITTKVAHPRLTLPHKSFIVSERAE